MSSREIGGIWWDDYPSFANSGERITNVWDGAKSLPAMDQIFRKSDVSIDLLFARVSNLEKKLSAALEIIDVLKSQVELLSVCDKNNLPITDEEAESW